ncbi:ABC transporter ATP-binding protein [Chitinasiproducens palmae]|uniref:Sulfonate transport system ATP-binding protein n=1 Tax=Chitinasiproducens palmae TaxID=1770053 RepID=A0A1H2PQ11_9BURK|nr:ATP-binding cassette domain-containing protein [Chitinasiproducens palmae]SDV48857.1 sulfonate transport system ATP-binding protein [Chitinasiproducens palmae]
MSAVPAAKPAGNQVAPARTHGRQSADASVRLERVTKRFGTRTVLRALDLNVEAGSFVAIVGRSGCGKSTLLRLIAGLAQAEAGRVTVDARPVRIMFQDARLLPWRSVLDNVALGLPRSSRERAREALRAVGLGDRQDDWPAQLSGGQRQRVALARALVREPALLLLDEPLGALDALTRIEMQALIAQLWADRRFTAVLVTHDVQEAVALADRVIVLDAGRIAFDRRIDLPRPRARGSEPFAVAEEDVLQRVLATAVSNP